MKGRNLEDALVYADSQTYSGLDDDPNFDESESTAYNSVISEENKEGQRKQDTGVE